MSAGVRPGPGYVVTDEGRAWRWVGESRLQDPVMPMALALSADSGSDHDPDALTDEQRERLADSAEWAAYAEHEAADILRRNGYSG